MLVQSVRYCNTEERHTVHGAGQLLAELLCCIFVITEAPRDLHTTMEGPSMVVTAHAGTYLEIANTHRGISRCIQVGIQVSTASCTPSGHYAQDKNTAWQGSMEAQHGLGKRTSIMPTAS